MFVGWTVVFLHLLNNVVSQEICRTPNGENGLCITFEKCEPFVKVYDNRTSKHIIFFRKSQCGYLGSSPLVCCGSVAEFTNFTEEVTKETTTTISITTNIPVETISTTTTDKVLPVSITTPQLFTSAVINNSMSTTKSGLFMNTLDNSVFKNHRNYNLIPVRGICGVQTTQAKIAGGNVTDIDEYPWLAMLLYKIEGKVKPNCGGSLINKRYVLTAAHCIKANLLAVRLGEYNIDTEKDCAIDEFGDEVCADPHQEFGIEDYVMHQTYSNRDLNRNDDIALIRLKRDAKLSDFVKPICLPLENELSNPGTLLTVAGWGLTEENMTSSLKMAVDIPIWSNIGCAELYLIGYGRTITPRQLCAGGKNGKDSCGGDSGGPLMRNFPNATEFYIEGIVSYGPRPCGRQATPGVYIRVSAYIEWILDNMQPF